MISPLAVPVTKIWRAQILCMDLTFRLLQEELTPRYAKTAGATMKLSAELWRMKVCIMSSGQMHFHLLSMRIFTCKALEPMKVIFRSNILSGKESHEISKATKRVCINLNPTLLVAWQGVDSPFWAHLCILHSPDRSIEWKRNLICMHHFLSVRPSVDNNSYPGRYLRKTVSLCLSV